MNVQDPLANVIYQVTLPSGAIITHPWEFGSGGTERPSAPLIVTDDGRVLVAPPVEVWPPNPGIQIAAPGDPATS